MATKLIELEDGLLVEVEVEPGQAQPISGGFAKKVGERWNNLQPILTKACAPLANAWRDLDEDFLVEQAEIEIGLSFEAEGNVYVAKGKAGANLNVKFILKAKGD